jgi:hypothetical protein
MNPISGSQDRTPWKNSHRFRIRFDPEVDPAGLHRPITKLICTLKMIVGDHCSGEEY